MYKIEEIKERFKDHEITTIYNLSDMKVFDFRNKSGTGNFHQRWIIDRSSLIVQGDCYTSVYRWSGKIDLKFLAGCDIGYFSSKCEADKDGAEQTQYSPEYAEQYIKNICVDHIYNNLDYYFEQECNDETKEATDLDIDRDIWDKKSLEEKLLLVKPFIIKRLDLDDYEIKGMFWFDSETDLYDYVSDSDTEFMFGSDAWEYFPIRHKTIIPYQHLSALRVANEKSPELF